MAIEVKRLRVAYGEYVAIEDFNMRLERGSIVALIGPSGSGKSTVAKAILRILPPIAKVSGDIYLDNLNILSLQEKYMRDLRLKKISYIPQGSSKVYLNPTLKISDIIRKFTEIGIWNLKRIRLEICS
ncbi:ATP-binding cassette domain-containing protein [Saccharolobus islandicus]|uniref:ATP-binding cassette domain-containing protein n=1 Tax=Saccharolobus islandicus TaxID=43080 RepID=UPI00037CD5E1|nr:ATP-binding cassette domain-containing protein [Sulfolobus islandicus]